MTSRRFIVGLAFRLTSAGVALAVVLWLLPREGYLVGSIVVAGVFALLIAEIWRHVSRTNREIGRFLDAAANADFSQRFSYRSVGSGFEELGDALTGIINSLRIRSIDQETEIKKLRALIEHIPVPLMTVVADGSIEIHNNAARRLFGPIQVNKLRDLRQFGAAFADEIAFAVPGERRLVRFSVEGIDYQMTLATTEIFIAGCSQRLISLQDIQSELDTNQAESWQELVNVLTHEIVNSIAPVTSLAASAAEVVDIVVKKVQLGEPADDELEDLQAAVSIVARRSNSLTEFIDSYRQISRLAPAEKKRVEIRALFDDVARLAIAECSAGNEIDLTCRVEPPQLTVHADRDLIEPVLLNLLRNARQATNETIGPKIGLFARINRRGHVVIEVTDNGPGVPVENVKKIFVPFFTTREGGSGVGLALARQVMIAHGGFVRVADNKGGGAVFQLTF